ncbi:hypothetical protein ES705_29594 [subsurface metagenome]
MRKFLIVLIVVVLSSFLMGAGCFISNRPPEITSDPVTTAIVGEDYIYNVVATDPDYDVLTYSLIDEPGGMLIDEDGVITWTPTVVEVVTFTVVVTDEGGLFDDQDVTITVSAAEVAVTGVTLDQATLDLVAGGATGTLVETVLPADATDPSVTWASSDEAVATVALGVVTPLTAGITTIKVTTVDGGFNDTCIVTVKAVEPEPEIVLTGIEVEPETMSLFVGETDFFKVTANYSDETTKNVTYDCVYVSNDPTIAKVKLLGPNNYQKSVEAVGKGIAKITVTYEGKKDTILVTVNPVLLTSIVVLPETMSLFVGEERTIDSVTAHYNFGPTAVIDLDACTYPLIETSTKKVVEVSDGVVKAVGSGTVAVIVTYQGKTDKLLVTVKPALLDHIVVDPDEMTLFVGEKEAFTVTAHYNFGDPRNITNDGDCVYESSCDAFASVISDPFSITQGWVEAFSFGGANIQITYTEDGIIEEAFIRVEVIGPVYNVDLPGYYNTIQKAIDEADPSDTIEVSAGTYDGFLVNKDSITIRATGEAIITIVDFPGIENEKGVVINADGVVIEGLTIDGSDFGPKSRGILGYEKVEYTVKNAIFINLGTGIYANATETPNVELTATGNAFTGCVAGIGGTENTILNAIEGNTFTDCVEGIGLGGGVQTTVVPYDQLIAYLQDNNDFVNCIDDVGDWR